MLKGKKGADMPTYNFDEIIDRRGTNAMNTDGFRQYIFQADEDMVFPYADQDFVRMWVADMEFATPPEIVSAIKDRADKRIFGYTKVFDKAYYESLHDWCVHRYGWHFPKEQLVTSPGIIPALYELVAHICAPDEKVIIFTPSYAYFKHAADFNERTLVTSDLLNHNGYYTMDLEDFNEKLRDEKVRLCIFCHPHNPTGRVWTESELEQFAEICQAHDLWVISDEIHCDLLRNGEVHLPLGLIMPEYEKLITCMSPSKTFNLAGLMFSNIIIRDQALLKRWKSRHYDFENPLSIAAAQAAYQHGEPWLRALKDYLDENFRFTQQYLQEYLPKAVFRIAEATYLAWVDVSEYIPPEVDFLPLYFANETGVLLEGGNMFVANSEGYIRLNLACPRAILEKGLQRICTHLNKSQTPSTP